MRQCFKLIFVSIQIEDDNRKAHVKFRKENPIFYEQVSIFEKKSVPKSSNFLLRFPNCCRDWRQSRRMCTSRAPTASTSPGRRGVRTGGKEGAERRKEEEEGKGETASQRGEKVEVGLEVVENTQLTSRLERSLESQVIILCMKNIFKPPKT